jgi:hypothetical protein
MNISTGTLQVATTIQTSQNLTLSGGTILGGTVTTSGSAEFVGTPGGGTLDGVTLNGNLDLTEATNDYLTIEDGLTLNGTASLGSASTCGEIYFSGSNQLLGGSGTLVFGSYIDSYYYTGTVPSGLYVNDDGATLTIGSGVTVDGGNGFIGTNSGYYYPPYGAVRGSALASIINQGTINADVAGTSLVVQEQSVSNSGTMEATGGSLNVLGLTGNLSTGRAYDQRWGNTYS